MPKKNYEYIIKIQTGGVHGAGTDAHVYIKCFTENNDIVLSCDNLNELSDKSNAFEANQIDTIKLYSEKEISEIHKIIIGHHSEHMGSDWFPETIEITCTEPSKKWFFAAYKWVNEENPELDLLSGQKYQIIIHTANEKNAGSSTNVSMEIHGKNNVVTIMDINKMCDKFDKNDFCQIHQAIRNLGTIDYIVIKRDDNGNDWCLDCVYITNIYTNESYYFDADNYWLTDKKNSIKLVQSPK